MAQQQSSRNIQVNKTSARMVQIAKYLDLSDAELEDCIREALESNPALRDLREEQPAGSEPIEVAPGDPSDGSTEEYTDDESARERSSDEDGYRDEDDYADYDDEPADSSRNWMEQTQSGTMSLAEDLLAQFDSSVYCSPELRRYVKGLVYRMSDNGIIEERLSDLKAEFEHLFTDPEHPYDEEDLLQALAQLQRLDPPGVGAVGVGMEGMARSMSLQLERKMEELEHQGEPVPEALDDALMIVDEYFAQLHDQDIPALLQQCGLDEQRFARALQEIRKLHVHPVGPQDAGPMVIQPDFVYDPESHEITYQGRQIGSLALDSQFLAFGERAQAKEKKNREDEETIRFVKQYQSKATQFIDMINTRTQAMETIMRVIAAFQRKFLESGQESDIKPLTMQEVADAAHVDTSTVSRVVNRRYIELPGGNFPLRRFFVSGLTTDQGEEVSKQVVLDCLSELVAAEDPAHPLSDQTLVTKLKERGFQVAIRTVNKYRGLLHIPDSRKRKRKD